MTVVLVELVLLLVLSGFTLLFVYTMMFSAPSVPTKKSAVEAMVRLADIRAGERAVDLGSGDGRVVMAMARAGAEAHGFEINPGLVLWSRLRIAMAGLRGKAFVHLGSFWSQDLSSYQVVTVYGLPKLMQRLQTKLRTELPAHARVISNIFKFPNWQPSTAMDSVRLYRADDRATA